MMDCNLNLLVKSELEAIQIATLLPGVVGNKHHSFPSENPIDFTKFWLKILMSIGNKPDTNDLKHFVAIINEYNTADLLIQFDETFPHPLQS